MGVPKFFRFISERWPLISKLIDEDQIPEFDNLYLDMNSILHNCTHSSGQNYDDLTDRVSDDEMYTSIFAYIDHLFNTIKPKKVFYMAIDGVAPRAKMNQQRSRRFRTALEAEKQRKVEQEQEALAGVESAGSRKDPSEVFDSNAITPGTEFMATLTRHLKFFIHKKVSTDANWQNIDVIFSGHEVPGEGEHKIMKYIRTMKLQPNYNPNVRHCIYGLDADLIMLGLVTHDPHFCLLREEVKFGPPSRNDSKGGSTLKGLELQKFYLLHLTLVREYLELEFSDLKNFLKFNYNFERILDDFILIMYLIGNDFLPNLPDLHINKGAFPLLLKTFKKFLINSDGYLNDDGKINFQRLYIWLDYLSLFEYENFDNGHVDIDWFNQKLDSLSLDNENKKKLIELKKRRFREQLKQSVKLKNKLLEKSQKKPVANGFDALQDDVETDEEVELDITETKLNEFHSLDVDRSFTNIFTYVEPWLLNIYSVGAAKIDIDSLNEEDVPELEVSNRLVYDRDSIQFDFLKQIAYDFDLVIVQDKDNGALSLKLDVDGIDPNETDDEYNERIANYHHLIEKYANKFGKVTEKEISELAKQIKDSDNNDTQFDNLNSYLEDSRFLNWKNQYYSTKFHFTCKDTQFSVLLHNYLEGLQWVLYYYYKGCPSWSWYYRYYYAPRISDISKGITDDLKIEFPKDTPFRPFQQLMGVLPARSSRLLPAVYHPLMLDASSPIIDFYPSEVEVDKNGKTAEWEYVLKLAFVDETRLLAAMKPYDSKLSPEEKQRNSFGPDLLFRFNPQVQRIYKSSLPTSFRDLENDNCVELVFELPHSSHNPDYSEDMDLAPFNHLCRGAKTGVNLLPGFPTLQTRSVSAELAIDYLVIFNQPSRSESMILTVNTDLPARTEDAVKTLGRIVYVSWPYLKEAKVVAVTDETLRYRLEGDKLAVDKLDDAQRKEFAATTKNMARMYHISKGIKLGKVDVLVTTVATNGLIRNRYGAYVKTFAAKEEQHPYQLVVGSVINADPRFAERAAQPVQKEFPIGRRVTFLGDIAYGNEAVVLGHKGSTELVLQVAKVMADQEPRIGAEKAYHERHSLHYFASGEAALQLRLAPLFLSKITSSFLIENTKGKRVNVGLDLKFEGKKLKVLGFTKRTDRGWAFSTLAIGLISEYRDLFPKFFRNLALHSKSNTRNPIRIQDLYPEESDPAKLNDKLRKITDYLDSKKTRFNTTTLGSESLNRTDIADIETFIIQYTNTKHPEITRNLKGVPVDAILDNQSSQQLLKKQYFCLGDRVVNVLDGNNVPLFAKGTVVGINVFDEKVSLNIVFDYPLINGNTLNGRLRSTRGLTLDSSYLLNLTHKQFIYHSKSSLERSKQKSRPAKPRARPETTAIRPKPVEKEDTEKAAGKKALLSLLKKGETKESKTEPVDNAQSKQEARNTSSEDVRNIHSTVPKSTKSVRNIDNDKAAKEVYGAIMNGLLKGSDGPNGPAPTAPSGPPPAFFPPPTFVPQGPNNEATMELKSLLKGFGAPNTETPQEIHIPAHNEPFYNAQYNGRGRGNFRGNRGTRGNRGRGRGRGGRGGYKTAQKGAKDTV